MNENIVGIINELPKGFYDNNLHYLEEELLYSFKDRSLMETALTHPSLVKRGSGLTSYERMEFLGDKVLNMIIADHLYRRFASQSDVGKLSIKLNYLVSGKVIVEIAEKINLLKYIKMSSNVHKLNLLNKKNSIEDSTEALIGAVYLDGGFDNAQRTVLYLWSDKLGRTMNAEKDPKTKLQEWLQGNGYSLPIYDIETKEGMQHEPVFNIILKCGNGWEFNAKGKSLKIAQTEAAQIALKYISNITTK